ncbi:MAG TPA: ribokinase [Candidatus Agrococcus pullicola]|uniref:Ribokinase n=1 Tax=Candidatus Agrococcus pullicola TaxID=2838429 RepID=A0A9D2C983_9MICO|nr:ribokinase [Candidatus Agrococcus pullicola]
MSTLPRIVCVGTAALDTIATISRFPGVDDRVEAEQYITAGGGNAATTAVTIARLGVPVEFSGFVGDDEIGDRVVSQLQTEGVGTSFVERRPGARTAQSIILVSQPSAARSIVTYTAEAPSGIPDGFDWVHLDKAGARALHAGWSGSAKVAVDDGNLIPDLDLGLVDLYVPTVQTLRERTGLADVAAAAEHARALGAGSVVATSGSSGSLALDEAGFHVAAALDITPKSTLGAGDVFHGALLAAVVLGKNMSEAIRFANVTAALSCRALDGRSGIPDRAEVEATLTRLPDATTDLQAIAARFGA